MKTDDLAPLRLSDIQYDLPDERIARFPLPQRDQAKLLTYKQGQIDHRQFTDLPDLLPPGSFLVFNNTKVIPARLHFRRETGAAIELFLLNPVATGFAVQSATELRPLADAMLDRGQSVWQCMIGNRKRWKPTEVLHTQIGPVMLTANGYDPNTATVRLSWTPADLSFAEVLQQAGRIPLPPYLNRDATDADRATYQTTYADPAGAVAAPTAGLHFTPAVLNALAERGFGKDFLTLHVGAGTFQPIKTDDVRQHTMHSEQVVYSQQNVRQLLENRDQLIPVGTTSMRALESLYWMGVQLLLNRPQPFVLDQHVAYAIPEPEQPPVADALQAVLDYLETRNLPQVVAQTGIYITPGYRLKLCKGLITNFHQPGSTLILLVSALIGSDWRRVYEAALANDYRFLSYGDSSLLLPLTNVTL
jgi:S-adenosylmethionine:tRNA ribosyltransferase-isomerase